MVFYLFLKSYVLLLTYVLYLYMSSFESFAQSSSSFAIFVHPLNPIALIILLLTFRIYMPSFAYCILAFQVHVLHLINCYFHSCFKSHVLIILLLAFWIYMSFFLLILITFSSSIDMGVCLLFSKKRGFLWEPFHVYPI